MAVADSTVESASASSDTLERDRSFRGVPASSSTASRSDVAGNALGSAASASKQLLWNCPAQHKKKFARHPQYAGSSDWCSSTLDH